MVRLAQGKLASFQVETKDYCLIRAAREMVTAAFERILEISIARELLPLGDRASFSLSVALWEGGLPVDLLPAEGWLEVHLGAENFAWPPKAVK